MVNYVKKIKNGPKNATCKRTFMPLDYAILLEYEKNVKFELSHYVSKEHHTTAGNLCNLKVADKIVFITK